MTRLRCSADNFAEGIGHLGPGLPAAEATSYHARWQVGLSAVRIGQPPPIRKH